MLRGRLTLNVSPMFTLAMLDDIGYHPHSDPVIIRPLLAWRGFNADHCVSTRLATTAHGLLGLCPFDTFIGIPPTYNGHVASADYTMALLVYKAVLWDESSSISLSVSANIRLLLTTLTLLQYASSSCPRRRRLFLSPSKTRRGRAKSRSM